MKFFIFFIFFISKIWASEVDSFYIKINELENAAPILNRQINLAIQEGMDSANRQSGCDSNALYSEIKKRVGRELISNIEEFALNNPNVPKVDKRREQSIFRDLGISESFLLYVYPRSLGVTLNLDGHLVGSDKIGHFFSEGYYYYNRYVKNENSLHDAFIFGADVYEGFFGLLFTGVYSYGDLVANFQGHRFWSLLVEGDKDVLGEMDIPYIACKDQHWFLKRKFDWKDYVDEGLDETKNCSQFASNIEVNKVKARLDQNELAKCLTKASSLHLQKRYQEYFAYLFNTKGISSYQDDDILGIRSKTELMRQSMKWMTDVVDWQTIEGIWKNFEIRPK